jgi:predicted GNAT superfamily acetyltransferase
VTELADAAGAHRVAALFAEVWATTAGPPPMSAHLIRALAHTGNYVAGAWAGDQLVGASVGFLALEDGRLSLHSHITGVTQRARGANVGFGLKVHQRAWAQDRGIGAITWTFDPLIRANAWFNLVKIGAVAVGYHPDFYGRMEDAINAGDRSDRCTIRWEVEASRVVAAIEGRPADGRGSTPVGAVLLSADAGGGPVVGDVDVESHRGPLLCAVPEDMVRMRTAAPSRARAWRLALRQTMGSAMAAGFVAGTITRDGWYVLTRPEDKEAAA